jgi:hypothetical protein
MRFFFDLRNDKEWVLDFRDEDFGHHEAAIDFANAIANDMTHRMSDQWRGWSVEVWNATGFKFIAVPVGTSKVV